MTIISLKTVINILFLIIGLNLNYVRAQLNFDWCCELGRRSAMNSRLCIDYSSLHAYNPNPSCKFAFTICCNQHNKNEECERGKSIAFQQDSCFDSSLNKYSDCDTFTDCCNCCQLGIQASKNNETCSNKPQLSSQCNKIQLDCCSSTQSTDVQKSDQIEKIDNCSDKEFCPAGQVCQETSKGPTCICPLGYEMNNLNNNTCIDIDECKQHEACPSGSNCENTIGSYKCIRTCQSGYVYDIQLSKCKDINECAISIHKCATGMRCENIPGSYRCIRETPCGTGYSIESLTQECIDIDECALNIDDCQKGFECINILGGFQCRPQECPVGFIFNFNVGQCEIIRCKVGYVNHNITGKCVDVDECENNPSPCRPSEKCVNNEGSFKCIETITCEGGYELDPIKSECIDIDECITNRHNCPQSAQCKNQIGTFSCTCPKGYNLSITGTRCEDIDECAYGSNCPRNSKCVNKVGSYECKCNIGFEPVYLDDRMICQDVNECALRYVCDHKCVNTYGSYQCLCNEGFTLSTDKRSCIDIDECQSNKNICTGQCINTPGSFECSCGEGYELDRTYKRYCTDIDECKLGIDNCQQHERCINVRGSFKCINITCPLGYNLSGGALSTRCDLININCDSHDLECIRKPVKIYYHYITFTRRVAVPIRILKTPNDILGNIINNQRSNSFSTKYEMKYISSTCTDSRAALYKPDFVMQYPSYQNKLDNSIELLLVRQPIESQEVKIEISIETYINSKFSKSSLNVINLIITD